MTDTNMLLRRLFLALMTLALTACASQSGVWVKSGTTPLQFNQDNYACLQESQQPFGYSPGGYGWGAGWGGFSGYSGIQTNQDLYAACMKARDYNWQPDQISR